MRPAPISGFLMIALFMMFGCGGGGEQSAASTKPPANNVSNPHIDANQPTDNTTPDESNPDMPDTAAPNQDVSNAPGVQHTNRLVNETSPYLLQHAHNPVDWYPWGDEAFTAAREQGKPIFLSVGYSTCYWCHVMERESFENEDVAALMNESFICIKVDREERPDVDDIYMTAVQLQTGRGGWPMTVFMEPDTLKPFFGGTYFPVEPRGGMITFPELLRRVSTAWTDQRADLMQQSELYAERISQMLSEKQTPRTLNQGDVQRAMAMLLSTYDSTAGGFGGGPAHAPKFPMPTNIDFILEASWDNPAAQQAALHTLDRMAMGGMYDHVGGGFHRYSTDARWLVPHFEKMLYDNGQLASTYAHAYDVTKDPFHAQVVRQTLEYVLREMTGEHGGFSSAQDAEVNAREGQNYLWRSEQVREVLQAAGLADDVQLALDVYGLSAGENFQDPHHPEDGRFNVLFLSARPDTLAEQHGMTPEEFAQRMDRINAAMLSVRDKRDQPGLDDKILTGWNGLMIAGLADGGRALQEPRYIDAAIAAADFLHDTLTADETTLLRTYRDGQAKIDGFLVDYAFLTRGCLALHRATGDSRWLETAGTLMATARELFWDDVDEGYFDTLADQNDLFVRVKSTYDGAVPSGMGVMLNNLLTLHERTGEQQYLDDAAGTLRSISANIAANPMGTIVSTQALHRFLQNHDATALDAPPIPVDTTSQVVALAINEDRAAVSDEVMASFELMLTIKEPWHINAHEPGDASLIGLSIELVGVQGLELEVTYPPGAVFAGPVSGMLVHTGSVSIPVTVRRTGEQITGQPQLVVKWQACDDKVCLEPEQEILNLAGGG